MEKWLKNLFKTIETTLGVTTKTIAGLSILGITVGFGILLTNENKIKSPTVMVTSLTNGGGSGVIYSTSRHKSRVLTNGHVCEILSAGGAVTKITGERHLVVEYTLDDRHDLCMLTVLADLGTAAKFATKSPSHYETAIVSGHPRLLPNVISTGHFSSNQIIQVLMGFRPCTEEELEGGGSVSELCDFFKQLPILKTFESKLITAFTMPGSSGSAVYNSKKEVSALVFANGNGYTSAVPHEYIMDFLERHEGLKPSFPNYILSAEGLAQRYRSFEDFVEKCAANKNLVDIVKNTCKIIERDVKWREYETNFNFNANPLPSFPDSDASELPEASPTPESSGASAVQRLSI